MAKNVQLHVYCVGTSFTKIYSLDLNRIMATYVVTSDFSLIVVEMNIENFINPVQWNILRQLIGIFETSMSIIQE